MAHAPSYCHGFYLFTRALYLSSTVSGRSSFLNESVSGVQQEWPNPEVVEHFPNSDHVELRQTKMVFLLTNPVIPGSIRATKKTFSTPKNKFGCRLTRYKGMQVERLQLWITLTARFSGVKSLLKTTQDYFFSFIWSI